jgi:hypothetical protein
MDTLRAGVCMEGVGVSICRPRRGGGRRREPRHCGRSSDELRWLDLAIECFSKAGPSGKCPVSSSTVSCLSSVCSIHQSTGRCWVCEQSET